MTGAPDKTQIGLTEQANEQIEVVVREGGFSDKQDAYRLAIAVALAQGLEPGDAIGASTTYGVGSLDPDGNFRTAVRALRDDHGGRPAAMMERLAHAGVAKVYEHLHSGKSLRELLALF